MSISKIIVLATSLLAWASPGQSATFANTGYIKVPSLVSAGMANVEAFVPAQAGGGSSPLKLVPLTPEEQNQPLDGKTDSAPAVHVDLSGSKK